MRLLLIEDDEKLGRHLENGLGQDGYNVEWHRTGSEGLARLLSIEFSVAIVDLGLPDIDGLDLIRAARAAGCVTPLLVLTARTRVDDLVTGLDAGANDYVAKPFSFAALGARLRVLTRPPSGDQPTQTTLRYDDLELDLLARKASRAGVDLDMKAKEFSLLECLMRNPERVMGKATLLETIWGYNFDPQTNVVEKLISRVRQKLEEQGERLIHTMRGVGYVLRR